MGRGRLGKVASASPSTRDRLDARRRACGSRFWDLRLAADHNLARQRISLAARRGRRSQCQGAPESRRRLQTQEKFAGAIEQYHAALALMLDPAMRPINDPWEAEVYTRLGDLLARQLRLDEAIGDYRRALAINPTSCTTHNNLAEVLVQQGNLAEAAAEYRLAIQYGPQVAACVFNLGLVFWQQGRLAEATAYYRAGACARPRVGAGARPWPRCWPKRRGSVQSRLGIGRRLRWILTRPKRISSWPRP